MFVVTLTYVKPLEMVDRFIAAHIEWLERQYDAGLFLASGRRVPRIGGVILANGLTRAVLEEVLAEDPFQQAEVAEYEIVEFVPSMTADRLSFLKEG
ncbi:MAG: YciI family protein [Aeromonas sp.]|jgi:uncharacterized protein YciI